MSNFQKKLQDFKPLKHSILFRRNSTAWSHPPSLNLTRAKQTKLLSLDGWQPTLHFKLQVARRIHTFVQYPDDDDSIVGDSKVNHMSLNTPSAIALQDELTAWRCFGGDS